MRIETCFAVNFPPLLVVNPSLFNILAISLRLLVSRTRIFSIATALLLLALLSALSRFVSRLFEIAFSKLPVKFSGFPSLHPCSFFTCRAALVV